jgi:hypothetical protein
MRRNQAGFVSHVWMVLGAVMLLLILSVWAFKAAVEIAEAPMEDAAIWLWIIGAGVTLIAGWGEITFLRLYPSAWLFGALSFLTVPLSLAWPSKLAVLAAAAGQALVCIVLGRLASRAIRRRYSGRPLPFWFSAEGNMLVDIARAALSTVLVAAAVYLPVMLLTLTVPNVFYVSMAWGLALSIGYSYARKARTVRGVPLPIAMYCAALGVVLLLLYATQTMPDVYDLSSATFGGFLPCLLALFLSSGISAALRRKILA